MIPLDRFDDASKNATFMSRRTRLVTAFICAILAVLALVLLYVFPGIGMWLPSVLYK